MKMRIITAVLLSAVLLAAACVTAAERTQKFAVKKGGTLELRTDVGAITVRGWDKDEVSLRVQSISEEQLKHVTWSDDGTNVKVEFRWRQDQSVPDWRGGVCCKVVSGGTIRLGDAVQLS